MSAPRPGVVLAIARHDLRLLLRQRWVLVYAALFAVLAASVSYFGLAVVEVAGWQELDRTAASLLNLALTFVPLGAMLMGVQSLRAEGGATDQLFAEPVTRAEVVLGKVAGASGAQTLATLLGFGLAGVVIGTQAGGEAWDAYAALVGFTALVGVVFVSLSSAVAVAAGRGARAYAAVLAVWFGFLILVDLVVVGLVLVVPEGWGNGTALAGVLLNPISSARVGALLALGGQQMFGPAGAMLSRTLGSAEAAVALLAGSLGLWSLLGMGAAVTLVGRQDL
ncbi:MAG TPA: ABC transporter permease subunit [Myxococcales bacterium]|jgi:Cu-processing system permease protein